MRGQNILVGLFKEHLAVRFESDFVLLIGRLDVCHLTNDLTILVRFLLGSSG